MREGGTMQPRSRFDRALAWALALLMAAPVWLEARVQPSSGRDAFSIQEEVQAGQQAAQQANKQLPILPDSSPITQYVKRLGANLAAHAPGERWPYNFHVVNQKEINAFALPGGPVYVNLGTIQAADNEAELAGVMAHEISHVVQRHATRAATKQMYAQLPLAILGGIFGGGALGQMAQMGLGFGLGSYFLKNSRQAEKEADLLGTDIMYDTGYDPHAMAQFFRKLEEQGGARTSQFFSDHPNPGNRFEYVSAEVQTLPPRQYKLDTPEFQDIHRMAMGAKPLTAQEIAQGQKQTGGSATMGPLSRRDVEPSSNFKPYEHQMFRIQYPENWQVMGDQQSDITIAPQAGITRGGVAYGAIISVYQPERQHASLDDGTHQLIQSLRQSNPQLRQIGQDEDIRVNAVAGKSVDLIGDSPIAQGGKAERERDWLVTVQRPDGMLSYVVFIAPDQDFSNLRPTFERMLRTLHLK